MDCMSVFINSYGSATPSKQNLEQGSVSFKVGSTPKEMETCRLTKRFFTSLRFVQNDIR